MYQDFNSWDPRKDDFEDRNFNSYAISGPARYLVGTRTYGNMKQVNTSLYVAGIPLELTERGLMNLFSRSGRVVHVRILPGKPNNRHTIGFVKMESIGDAERAIRDMNNFQLEGFRFKVKMARSDDEKARLKEEQFNMQSYYFNNGDDSDPDENFNNQSFSSTENQPQSVTNGYRDYPGYKPKGRGRGEVLSELTGLYGKSSRSLPMQHSPNLYAGQARTGLGPGGDNAQHGGALKKQGLLPTPTGAYPSKGPVENLSITIDHENHRNLSRMKQTITLDSLNRGRQGQRDAGCGSMFDQYRPRENYHMTSRGQGRGQTFYQGQPRLDIYSSYGTGSGGYGRGTSLPGSYPHQTPMYGGPQSPMTKFPQAQVGLLQPAVSPRIVSETYKKENKEKPKPKEVPRKECTYCGKLGASACTLCKSPYCSKDCQKADWPKHKHICKAIGRENEVAEAFESKFSVSVGDELIPEVKKLMERATGDRIEITMKERKDDTQTKSGGQSDSSDGQSRSKSRSYKGNKKASVSNKNRKLDEKKNVKQKANPGGYETDTGMDRRNKGRNETEGAGYETDVGRDKRGCFNCGKTDHIRSGCPQPHGKLSQCFNCKKMGHMSKACPEKSGKLTQTAKPKQTSTKTKTEEPNADGDWDNDADISTPVVKESVAPLAQSTPVSEHNKGKERSSNSMMSSRQSIPVAELPVNKDVAVVVTHTKSAMEIWLQDIQQTLPIQDTMIEMGNKFPNCPCDVKLNEVKTGDYYGAKYIDEAWYRVQVKNVSRQGDLNVHYIDFGNTETAKIHDLRQLDPSMMKESAKAILCAFEGVDSGTSVKIDPDILKKHVVTDKMYEARCTRVLDEEGRKIFQISLKNTEGKDVLGAIMDEIKAPLDSQLKKPSEKHSVTSLNDIPYTQLKKGQKYAALFAFVVSPNLFSVQILDLNNLSEFAEFDLQLQEFYNSKDKPHYRPTAAGEIIISKYSEDQKWYRAEVKELYNNEVDVVFIDFGNSERTPVESCRQIVPDFIKFERKCFQCCHHGFEIPETCPKEIINLYQHFSTNIVMIEIRDVNNAVYGVELHSTDGQSYSEEIQNLLKQTEQSKSKETSSMTLVPNMFQKQGTSSPILMPDTLPNIEIGSHSASVKETVANIEYRELQMNTEIKVFPIDIVSLRLFHVRLKSDEQSQQLANVMLDLNKVCTAPRPYNPTLDEFVAAQFFDGEQTLWYRGQVLEISSEGFRILYVDYGNISVVKSDAIAKLDSKYCSLPTLAIPCSLRGMEDLVDSEVLLNSFKNILNKVVIVKAVTCVNGIYDVEMYLEDGISLNQSFLEAAAELEVDSDDAVETGGNVGLDTQKDHLKSPTAELTQAQYSNNEAATRLGMEDSKAIESGMVLDGSRQTSVSNSLENIRTSLPRKTLPFEMETPTITVHINNLASFYVQRTDEDSGMGLLHMTTELNSYCEQETTPYPCQEGQLVAALFDEGSSKSWYRAQVLSLDGSTAMVSFIDYGNTDRVKLSDVRQLDTKFLDLPIMGIHCCLAGSDGTEPDASVEEFKVILNHAVNLRVIGVQGDLHFVEMSLKNPEKTNVNELFRLDSSKVSSQALAGVRPMADGDLPELENTSSAGQRACAQDQPRDLKQQDMPSESLTSLDIDPRKRTSKEPPPAVLNTGTPILGAAMHIESVSCFYIMLGDFQVQSLLGQLMTELNKECAGKSAPHTPVVGEYVAAFYLENKKDGLWYRGVVTELCDKNRFKVHYIDYGNTAVIETEHIQKLDEKFLELPSFVAKCKLVDCDQLNEESSQLFKAYQDVALTIQAERQVDKVYEVQVFTQDNRNIRDSINIQKTPNKYGSDHGSRLEASASTELVDQLPKAYTPVKDPLPKKSASPQSAERMVVFSQTITKSRPQGKEFEVVITSSVRPNLFHCHVRDDTNVVALKLLSDNMRVDCSEGSFDGINGKFEVGEMCCAKFIDGEWYRATILDVFPDNTVAVEYVDFGNRSEVNSDQLRPVRPEYTELPLLAFKCTLHGVFPTETSWSEKAVEEFKKFSDKVLFAKLIDVTSDDVYVLDLTDCDGVNVAQHLIDAGLAKKEEAVDDTEKVKRENELLRKQLELMQSQMAMLKMNQ